MNYPERAETDTTVREEVSELPLGDGLVAWTGRTRFPGLKIDTDRLIIFHIRK